MSNLWNNVTAQNVLQAIDLFDRRQESYPPARNTFLLYNDREYPAKHIRGLAYKIANQKEISKDNYSGGEETVNFLANLGFTVKYKGKIIQPKQSSI